MEYSEPLTTEKDYNLKLARRTSFEMNLLFLENIEVEIQEYINMERKSQRLSLCSLLLSSSRIIFTSMFNNHVDFPPIFFPLCFMKIEKLVPSNSLNSKDYQIFLSCVLMKDFIEITYNIILISKYINFNLFETLIQILIEESKNNLKNQATPKFLKYIAKGELQNFFELNDENHQYNFIYDQTEILANDNFSVFGKKYLTIVETLINTAFEQVKQSILKNADKVKDNINANPESPKLSEKKKSKIQKLFTTILVEINQMNINFQTSLNINKNSKISSPVKKEISQDSTILYPSLLSYDNNLDDNGLSSSYGFIGPADLKSGIKENKIVFNQSIQEQVNKEQLKINNNNLMNLNEVKKENDMRENKYIAKEDDIHRSDVKELKSRFELSGIRIEEDPQNIENRNENKIYPNIENQFIKKEKESLISPSFQIDQDVNPMVKEEKLNESINLLKSKENSSNIKSPDVNNFSIPFLQNVHDEQKYLNNQNDKFGNYQENKSKEIKQNFGKNHKNPHNANPPELNIENKTLANENEPNKYDFPLVESVYMTESDIKQNLLNPISSQIKNNEELKQTFEEKGKYEISNPPENKENNSIEEQINFQKNSPKNESIINLNQGLTNSEGKMHKSKIEKSVNQNIQNFIPGSFSQSDHEENLDQPKFLLPNQSIIIKSNTTINGIDCRLEKNNIDIKINLGCGHNAHKNCLLNKLIEVDKTTGNLRDIYCNICSTKIDYRILVGVNAEIAENLDISTALLNNYLQSTIE